ncbi:TetR/AcrR family transcriptional regulator [Streptomyces sp. PU-14G]|uniref:TetR/AcrR family transcriptional regulator n=1 Tax=Streptomyces sp. PU-14G TaxID=2800808 RepID=UPI0034DE5DBF
MARPKSFDPDAALDRAVEIFWTRGYEATSVDDLVSGIGIKRQSLYDTFGDKRALYLASLDRYEARLREEMIAVLEAPGEGVGAIESVLRSVIDPREREGMRCGCFLVNAAVEVAMRDPEAALRVHRNAERIESALLAALERASAAGELPERRADGRAGLRALARYLANALRGLQVALRMGTPEAELRDVVDVTLSALR